MTKVKRTQAELDGLRQEIEIMKSLRHPCILTLLDAFETEQDVVLVLEYALGDLREIVEYDKCVTEEALAPVAAQLIHALHFLHSCHIIHRDIKPSNVLLKENGAVCYADFGFARSMGASTVALVSMKGTPLYMSPECIHGKPYDFRSDLWSLGALLYELAVGHPPFMASNVVQLSQRVARDPVDLPPTMSPSLRNLLGGLLVKDPAGRMDWRTLMQHPFIQAATLPQMGEDIGWFEAFCSTRSVKRTDQSPSPTVSTPRAVVSPELLAASRQTRPEKILADVTTALTEGGQDIASVLAPAMPILDFASRSPSIASASLRLADAACSTQGKVQLLKVPVPRSLLFRIQSQISRGDLQHFLYSAPATTVAAAQAVPQGAMERAFAALIPALRISPESPEYRPVLFDCACLSAAAIIFRAGGLTTALATHYVSALQELITVRSPVTLLLLALLYNSDVSGSFIRTVCLQSIARTFTQVASSLTAQYWWVSPVKVSVVPPTFRSVLSCTGRAAYVAAASMFIHSASSAPDASAILAETMWPALVSLTLALPRPVDPELPAFGLLASAALVLLTSEVTLRKTADETGAVPPSLNSSKSGRVPFVQVSDQLCDLLAQLFSLGCRKQPPPDPDGTTAAGQALWLARTARVNRGENPPLGALGSALGQVIEPLPTLPPRIAAVVVSIICRVLLAHIQVAQPFFPKLLEPATVRAILSSELPPEALSDGLMLISHIGRVFKEISPYLGNFPADALLAVLNLSAANGGVNEPQSSDAQDLRARLRSKCANTVGNLLRYSPAALPRLEQSGVLNALVPLLGPNETPECARWAAFALGNAAFHSGDLEAFELAVGPLCGLLSHPDKTVRLNATGSISNILRHSPRLHSPLAHFNVAGLLTQELRDYVGSPDVATAAALALCSVANSNVLRPTIQEDLYTTLQQALQAVPDGSQLARALARLNERLL